MTTFTNHQDIGYGSEDPKCCPIEQWRVLWTKPRQEKALGRYLEARGARFFLPLVQKVHFIGKRKLRSNIPLFPSYVFLDSDLEAAYEAVSTKRVCSIIEVPDQERFADEISQIQCALLNQATLDLYPFVVVGRHCRVLSGPFQGIEGVVSSRLGPSRLALQVRTLGQAALLEIDADLIEPI